jgi:molybdopterin molybdotransferase/putative molybdopterin biosynthesis protein
VSDSSRRGDRPAPQVAYARWTDALARAGWRTGPDADQVPVAEGLGRVTAAPVQALGALPSADCAAMDGIAVAAAAVTAAAGAAAAGTAGAGAAGAGPGDGDRVPLPRGAFEWIDTGDPMPPGTDAVIERERVLPGHDGGVIIIIGRHGGGLAPRGRNVRAAGEDFAAGELLVPAGRRLRPADLAVAAAGGHATLAVARRPAVAIIPTGDEIRPVGTELRYGDITDTNSLMLAARCRQAGARPAVSPVQPDDPDALAAEIRRSAADADLVLVIAGSSRGRGDHTAAVLAQVGGVAVTGAAVRPGHPVLLGHAKPDRQPAQPDGIVPVVGVPGYPLAAAVIFELFALPLLAAIGGWRHAPDTRPAVLDRDWASRPGVEEWVPVRLTRSAGRVMAAPGRHGAGSVSRLARADAWWPIPPAEGTIPAGTVIEVRPIPGDHSA